MTDPTYPEFDAGPLVPLLKDETVVEIMVNGPNQVYVERRRGKPQLVEVAFRDNEHIIEVINNLLTTLNLRPVSSDYPYASARFPDGSRLQAFIPPIAVSGPSLTLYKVTEDPITLDNLLRWGSVTQDIADFLRACVQTRLNILVSGGIASGKTTIFNVLASAIPAEERLVTIEEEAELRLKHEHIVVLESRPPNDEGKGEISVRDLLRLVPRARPDRILIGELNGPGVLEMLRLMDRGYEGTMTTIFANSPQEALERLEMMVKMNEPNLPVSYLRILIGSAVNLVVQQLRLEDGSRKVVRVTEVLPVRGSDYELHDVFVFQREGFERGRIVGSWQSQPVSLSLMRRMEARRITLPPSLVPMIEEG